MKEYVELTSGKLTARVLTPESPLYGRTRFNHVGFIPMVTYGSATFAQPEALGDNIRGSSGGRGFCTQYIFEESELKAKEGESFLRLGIGKMTREKEIIFFMRDAAYEPLTMEMESTANSALFRVESQRINGYAYEETRQVLLEGNTLTVKASFKNVGEKAIKVMEYNHNFVAINALPVGKKYSLLLPCVKDVAAISPDTGLTAIDGGVTWKSKPRKNFFSAEMPAVKSKGYSWLLKHEDTTASVSETDDFKPKHITVWGTGHCISTEVFYPLNAKPGETKEWTRTWTFTE